MLLVSTGASAQTPATLTVEHPRYLSSSAGIMFCQGISASDCDYSVVGSQDLELVPQALPLLGVAPRKTAMPWTGQPLELFSFAQGTSYNPRRVYIPVAFTYDAGSGTSSCVIQAISPASRVRLMDDANNAGCYPHVDLAPYLQGFIGQRQGFFKGLFEFPENFVSGSCLALLTNNAASVLITVGVTANCGSGPVPRVVTTRLWAYVRDSD